MKRKIEDYINKGDYAVLCSSIEEWNTIVNLINKNHVSTTTQLYCKVRANVLNLQNLNTTIGTGTLKHFPEYTIYPASDFLEKEFTFEKEKWYKRNEISNSKDYLMYVKSLEINIKDNTQIYKERINGDGEYINFKKTSSCTFKNFTLLTDLSEIQEFLPDNHPDKIVKLTSFPLEGCVYNSIENLEVLAKYLVNRPFNRPDNQTLKKDAVGIGWNTTGCWWLKTHTSGKTEYKLSDLESFLPKTEIIPEYVECIKGSGICNYNIIGKIYKVESYDLISGDLKILGEYISSIFFGEKSLVNSNRTDFKPSTKEAFDLQNKSKQLTVSDLIEGEIYKTNYKEQGDYIFKYQHFEKECWLNTKFTNYSNGKTPSNLRPGNGFYVFQLATNEEKKWLNTCISQDKFIPKEDLHLYNDSGLLVKMNEKMKSILKEAKKRYPIGTKFKCVKDSELAIVEQELKEDDQGFIYTQFPGNRFHQFVYAYDKWAEIVSLPNEQVQKEKSLVEQVRKGLKLKGRWLKCIENCDWNSINVGEYIQILQNNDLVSNVKWTDNEKDYCLDLARIDRKEFELMPEDFSPNEKECIPKVGDWCITTVHYNDEIWYKDRIWQIGKIDEDGFCIPIENGRFLKQSLKIGFRKALPHEIPNQSVQTTIYDFGEIHIPSITKKTKKLQTITIESTTDLNLNLTKIKSKQIQTIKI